MPPAAWSGTTPTCPRSSPPCDGCGPTAPVPAIVAAVRRLRPNGAGQAVILGAGGAARGVEVALTQCGVARPRLVQRSDGSWERMDEALDGADLVVNATPIGTRSDESPLPVE